MFSVSYFSFVKQAFDKVLRFHWHAIGWIVLPDQIQNSHSRLCQTIVKRRHYPLWPSLIPVDGLPGQFLEHGDGFIDDAFAGAGFGVTVETGPALIAAELVAFLVRNVTDPIVGQFRDVSVAEGRA